MKVGVIAELNPFHYGHEKLLREIRKKYGDCTIIMVLSGHFLQRGIPSVLDKWTKTEIALSHGVDLVVELPFPFATQSADIFASGAIKILNELKIDVLAFGTETEDIEALKLLATAQENEIFESLIQVFLRMGKNYPTAISCALEELTGKRVDLPNDLLAISYIKAMNKEKATFSLFPIKRGKHSHQEQDFDNIESGSSIRAALQQGMNLKAKLPDDVFENLQKGFLLQEDYFPLLRYQILSSTPMQLNEILGVNETFLKKLKKEIIPAKNYDDFIKRLHTKNYTYNYISRMLLHILVGFTKEDAKLYQDPTYLRILGFSKSGRAHLNQIKKETKLPLLSKFERNADLFLQLEMKVTQIYTLPLSSSKRVDLIKKEFGQAPIQRKEKNNDTN